jgi:hypothetical protein
MNTGGFSLRIKANVVELVLKFKYLSALSLFEVVEEGTNIYMHLMASPTHVLLTLCTRYPGDSDQIHKCWSEAGKCLDSKLSKVSHIYYNCFC